VSITGDLNYEHQKLLDIVDGITEQEEAIKTLSDQAGHEATVEGIIGYGLERAKHLDDLSGLEEVLENIKISKEKINHSSIVETKLMSEAVDLIKENKLCPLCGGEIDEDVLKHVREWL